MPNEIDYARLAAYIDGEGSISVSKNKFSRKHGIYVRVTNTDARLLEWCKNLFGGSIYCFRERRRPGLHINGGGCKPCSQWCIIRKSAAILLKHCLPYFIIKKQQAEIAIALQETIGANGVGPAHRLSDDTLRWRNSMANQIKMLNVAGYIPPSSPSSLAGQPH